MKNGVISVESINEKGEMEKLRKAMGSVGFCKETQNTVFSMISAVLLLGNVNYVKVRNFVIGFDKIFFSETCLPFR